MVQMNNLQEQIAEAQAAQERVEQLRYLEAQAAELPKLLKQQEDQEWIEGVRPLMALHRQSAATQVAEATTKMSDWRKDFLATVEHLTELVNALPELQNLIHKAAGTAQQVASTQAEIARRQGSAVEFGDPTNFGDLWRELGGYNTDLQPLPGTKERYQKLEPLIKLLITRQIRLYSPEELVREYRDRGERSILQ